MQKYLKTDQQALNWGIIFSALLALSIIFMGAQQATLELEPNPGIGQIHYEWQLANPTPWSQVTIWLGFVLHQLAVWATIYYARKQNLKYSDTLRPINYWALGINAVFCILHYLQTLVFYDSMAQYIPSGIAQWAVIFMLVIILALENNRRGLFFGKKVPFKQEFIRWLKDYHGYIFSLAVIYTFWYHPMVVTAGHLFGFFYVMLVMVQGSLMFTRAHLNKNWKLLLEVLVLPHAAYVAYLQGGSIIYMFMFGFMGMFVVTQMHGVGLKSWVKNLFLLVFVGLVAYVYFVMREPRYLNEVIRIPSVEYLTIFVIYGVWWVATWTASRFKTLRSHKPIAAGD
jgi:hypothetical protein